MVTYLHICSGFLKAVATFFHHLNWTFHRWLLEGEKHCHGLLPGNGLAFHWCLMRRRRRRWESGLDLCQEVVFLCSSKYHRSKLMRSPWCVVLEVTYCHWNNTSRWNAACMRTPGFNEKMETFSWVKGKHRNQSPKVKRPNWRRITPKQNLRFSFMKAIFYPTARGKASQRGRRSVTFDPWHPRHSLTVFSCQSG